MCFGLEVNSSSAAFNLLWTTKGQTERNSVPSSACAAGGSANWLLVVRRRNDLHTFTHTFWQIVQVLCAQGISKVSMISVKPFHFRILLSLLKSKFYKKRGATFFYDITLKSGPLDFTQYRSKSSSF